MCPVHILEVLSDMALYFSVMQGSRPACLFCMPSLSWNFFCLHFPVGLIPLVFFALPVDVVEMNPLSFAFCSLHPRCLTTATNPAAQQSMVLSTQTGMSYPHYVIMLQSVHHPNVLSVQYSCAAVSVFWLWWEIVLKMINTFLLYIPLLALTDRRND
jgi:hypothetical protein